MNVQHSLQQTQLFTHALSHSFSQTYQGAQCRVSYGPRSDIWPLWKAWSKLEKLPLRSQRCISTSLSLWLWWRWCGAAKAAGGCFFRGDSCLAGTQRCSNWWPRLLWPIPVSPIEKNFAQAYFSGEETGLGQDRTQCVTVGSQRGADASYSGQQSAEWQPGKRDILIFPPLLTSS